MKKGKVIVGMSGGVDSSVSAYLLKEQGFEVIGVTLNHNKEKFLKEEVNQAKKIAKLLGIKHIEIDIEQLFQRVVVDDFLQGYSNGITPSPCVICDERVKFKVLFEMAGIEGAEFVASGHYCSSEYNPTFDKTLLKVSYDKKKDQSYMLSRLEEDKIKRLIFPLEKYTKSEIREIAKKAGLEVHDKKDSQGICFAKSGYINFLKKNLGDKIQKGKFIDKDGNILGVHEGYQLYTLGQRRGLGLKAPRPYFITKIIPSSNLIVLGEYEDLAMKKVELREYKEIVSLEKLGDKILIGRPRFSSSGAQGKIYKENEKVYFEYLEDNFQNAPGQHLVIYYDDFVVGSGIIEN